MATPRLNTTKSTVKRRARRSGRFRPSAGPNAIRDTAASIARQLDEIQAGSGTAASTSGVATRSMCFKPRKSVLS